MKKLLFLTLVFVLLFSLGTAAQEAKLGVDFGQFEYENTDIDLFNFSYYNQDLGQYAFEGNLSIGDEKALEDFRNINLSVYRKLKVDNVDFKAGLGLKSLSFNDNSGYAIPLVARLDAKAAKDMYLTGKFGLNILGDFEDEDFDGYNVEVSLSKKFNSDFSAKIGYRLERHDYGTENDLGGFFLGGEMNF